MTASVTLIGLSGTTPTRVLCDNVTVSGTKKIESTPNANIGGPIEVQTLAYENLSFAVTGVRVTGEAGTLTWADILTLYKHKYTGANPITLTVTYGTSTTLVGLSGVSPIRVELEDFKFPIDVKNSKNGYLPVMTLTFVETA